MRRRYIIDREWADYIAKNEAANVQYREMPLAHGHARASDPSGCLVCGAKTNARSGLCMRCRTEET